MKLAFLASAIVLATLAADAAPFPQPQAVVVATSIGYKSRQYTIASGATEKGIEVPVSLRPVHLMIATTTDEDRGFGEATIMRAAGQFLQWLGADYASQNGSTPVALNSGFSTSPGTHIMYADFLKDVDVQVETADKIQLKNTFGAPVTVIVTFMY
jgi:hypothetical protein